MHGAALAPWQLARIMRTVRMHHVRRAEPGGPLEGVEKYTFLPHATLVLVSGGAAVLGKTRLERAADGDADGAADGDADGAADGERLEASGERSASAAAPAAAEPGVREKAGVSRARSWSVVRRAAEHRQEEMARFRAPCIVTPPQTGVMFRVAFDAETRFATDEDGIYTPPQPSALVRLNGLAQQVPKLTRPLTT